MKFPKIDSVSAVETFQVTAGALRVTDPCYDMETWCAGTLDNVLNGTWDAHVGYHKDSHDDEMSKRWLDKEEERIKRFAEALGEEFAKQERESLEEKRKAVEARPGRVAYIHIVAQGYERKFDAETPLGDEWQLSGIDVGVDSGQAGFFDVAKYALSVSDKSASRANRGETFEAFYDSVCNMTLEDKSFGTLHFGCVSSSGYGDGGYDCYFRRNDVGQVIEALIAFIPEYEEEETE